jgi:hypothetical protein
MQKRILINKILIENGKIVNSLNNFLKIENGFGLVIQIKTLFIFKVLSDSKICKKNIN